MKQNKTYCLNLLLLILISQKSYADAGPLALGEGININSSGTVQITVQANVVTSNDIRPLLKPT